MTSKFQKIKIILFILFFKNIIVLGQRFNSIIEADKQPEKVIILDLSDKKLSELPIQIENYKNLEEIDLHDNPNLNLEKAFNILSSNGNSFNIAEQERLKKLLPNATLEFN